MFKAFPKSDKCFAALLRVLMFAKSLLNLLFFAYHLFASAPGVLRVGGTYGYASRLGPVRRLPASNSPNGTYRSSDRSLGPAMGSSRFEQAFARSAANAAWALQRRARAVARTSGCRG